MADIQVQLAGETPEEPLEVLSGKEARALKGILTRMIRNYGSKPAGQDDESWLKQCFLKELPGISEADAASLSRDAVESIRRYDEQLDGIKRARLQGQTAAEWFAEETQRAATGMSAAAFGERMCELDTALSAANAQMMRTVTTQDGAISQQWNLDGFIAEQRHVASFNAAAKLEGGTFYAEVCAPEPGVSYGKNSFDIVIRDGADKIVHQYQCKYGADAETTIQMLRRGNYNNQTLLVPPEQVEQVQAAFPGKTVVARIGGTEKVPAASQPLSKAEAKALQVETQQTSAAPEMNWGSYDSKLLAKYVGKQAALAGMQGAVLATGFHLAAKLAASEPIDAEEAVAVALETGVDAGVKAATAGALKIAVEKGVIGCLPPGTPVQILVNLSCVAIENVKILAKVAAGELTLMEGLDLMGCNTVAMAYGLGWGAVGAVIGTAALDWVPIVGPIVGSFVGGMVGYMAGSKFGQKIYECSQKVSNVAVKAVKKLYEAGRSGAQAIKRRVRALLRNEMVGV